MPKRSIDYCLDIMEYLKSKGFEKQAPAAEIRIAISIRAGALEATRKRYFMLLQEFGFMKPAGNGVFELDFNRMYELTV